MELAISHVHSRHLDNDTPKISNLVPPNLPFVLADGEWLVELLSKLLSIMPVSLPDGRKCLYSKSLWENQKL
ncbi:MAG UNVERIFIED_CONTAM: hypothetical protein LVR29_01205 [Microcystis novacekii LVE1205-3]